MARHRERTTDRRCWDRKNMAQAMYDVLKNKLPINAAARSHCVPEPTLRRYINNYNGPSDDMEEIEKGFPESAGRFKKTFSADQSDALKAYIADLDRRAFGLTKAQFGRVCYDFAESLGISHRFNNDKKVAGRDFIDSFLKNCGLTLRRAEAPGAPPGGRPPTCDRKGIDEFFDVLGDMRRLHQFRPDSIYSVVEVGISMAPSSHPNVISPRVGCGVVDGPSTTPGAALLTAVCAASASGSYIPPFFVFSRLIDKIRFLEEPRFPDSRGVVNESGGLASENFSLWLGHFVRSAARGRPALLLVDNHASLASSPEVARFLRDSDVHVLGFPAHTWHALQPLDAASFRDRLGSAFAGCCGDHLSGRGGAVSMKEVCAIFAEAYSQAATVQTAVEGFRASGVEPLDSSVHKTRWYCEPSDTPAGSDQGPGTTVMGDGPQCSTVETSDRPSLANSPQRRPGPISDPPEVPTSKQRLKKIRLELPCIYDSLE